MGAVWSVCFEEDDWIDGESATRRIERGDKLAHKGEIEHAAQAAVAVVSRD
jgi:hypothetical protein